MHLSSGLSSYLLYNFSELSLHNSFMCILLDSVTYTPNEDDTPLMMYPKRDESMRTSE